MVAFLCEALTKPRKLRLIVVMMAYLIISPVANASTSEDDLSQIDIYLHTVNYGSLVYDNFGHTAIRVHNRSTGQDLIYNWGIFDFGDPIPFMKRYYEGDLVYKLGVYPFKIAYQQYNREARSVWQDKLVLAPSVKKSLLEKLEWNARLENRMYQYDYFYDNCSTRPRDYLDYALGGKLKSYYTKMPSEKTFREYIRKAYATIPPIQLLLDISLNGLIDRKITVWETMFHPLSLRQAILDYNPLIVIESKQILSFPAPKPAVPDGFYGFSFFGLVFLIPIMLLLFFAIKAKGKNWRHDGSLNSLSIVWSIRLLGLLGILLYGFAAILGVLFPINTMYSGHDILKYNFNSLLFFPLDFILLIVSVWWLISGRPLAVPNMIWRPIRLYMQLHIISAFALMVAWGLNLTSQNLSEVIIHVLPVYLALFSLTIRIGIHYRPPAPGR